MALPKWTDERTEELTNFVGDESPKQAFDQIKKVLDELLDAKN